MRKRKAIAQLRRMICTAGYYRKRMRLFERKQAVCQRLVASVRRYSDQALKDLLRYEQKAEWYRRRVGMEPVFRCTDTFELVLTEVRFRMLARDIRGLFGFEDVELRRESLVLTAQLLNKTFRVIIPEEWIHD